MPTPVDLQRNLPARMEAANLSIVHEDEASPAVGRLYTEYREAFGRPSVPGILQCFATHPPLLEHMLGLAQTMLFVEGALTRKQKELIATYVSATNACAYCADSHGFTLGTQGGTPEMVSAAMRCDLDCTAFSLSEHALLRFVEKVTKDSQSITPADTDNLRAFGWTDLQISEAIHLTALFACFNRVVSAFGLPSQNLLGPFAEPDARGAR
jgi:uncharacterized peroxidase-related enzyme